MVRWLTTALLLCLPPMAAGADDYKVLQLEQDVRELTRQVQAQARQIDDLRRQLARPGAAAGLPPATPATPATPVAVPAPAAWLDAARWARLAPGAAELDVIQALGPPTSMRMQGDERVLLYAMEIGASGFLGGSVTLRDRVVTGIRLPVLQ